MANKEPPNETDALRHADLSSRPPAELSASERAELKRRFESFVNHVRDGKLAGAPAGGKARRIRKWRP